MDHILCVDDFYLFQKRPIGSYKCSSSGRELINIRFRTSIFVSFSASKRLYFFRFVASLFFLRSRKFKNKVVQTISYPFARVLFLSTVLAGMHYKTWIGRNSQISPWFGTDLFLPKPFCRFCRLHLPYVSVGETLVSSFSNNLGKTQYEHLSCNIPFFLLLYNNNNNNLTIIILSLFTLGSIYSTYASGAEKMTETKSLNQTINRFKNPATGRRQTSWLFTSLVEDLNSGRLWRSASGQNSGNPRPPNCKSGVLTAWPRCPLPFSSLCVHFFLSFSYTVVIVALVRPRTFRRFCLNLFIDNWLQMFSSQVLANPGSYIFPKNCRNQVDWAILDLNTIFWAFVTYWREIIVKSWTR